MLNYLWPSLNNQLDKKSEKFEKCAAVASLSGSLGIYFMVTTSLHLYFLLQAVAVELIRCQSVFSFQYLVSKE